MIKAHTVDTRIPQSQLRHDLNEQIRNQFAEWLTERFVEFRPKWQFQVDQFWKTLNTAQTEEWACPISTTLASHANTVMVAEQVLYDIDGWIRDIDKASNNGLSGNNKSVTTNLMRHMEEQYERMLSDITNPYNAPSFSTSSGGILLMKEMATFKYYQHMARFFEATMERYWAAIQELSLIESGDWKISPETSSTSGGTKDNA